MKDFIITNKAALIVLAAAAVMICAGVVSDEVGTVFTKAIRICLECIGIG